MTDPVMLLSQVHGEGRVTFRALRAAGFFTLEGVAEASVHLLSDRAHLSVQTARRLKAGASEMLDRGLGAIPPASDPSAGTRAWISRTAGKNGRVRKASADLSGPPVASFSEGISLQEAALLGQGCEPLADPPLPPRHLEIAAAAEMAAELIRVPPQPPSPVAARPAASPPPRGAREGRTPGGFWSFG